MNFRGPAIYIVIFVVIAASAGSWFYAQNKKQNTASTSTQTTQTTTNKISNLSNIDPTEFDAVTKKTYASANQLAMEADSSYKIAGIEVNVDKDLSPDTFITRYIFNNSAIDSNYVITFGTSGSQYIRALIPTKDYAGTLSPMNTKAWKYNFVTALQLAEKNGGLSWRESNKLTDIKLMLKHTGTKNWLLWVVTYQGDNNQKLTISLDANSGNVMTE